MGALMLPTGDEHSTSDRAPAELADTFFHRVADAVSEERLRQAHELLSGRRSHFDDAALAAAALSALHAPSPQLLLPLAQLIRKTEEAECSRRGERSPDLEAHAGWIASTWNAIVDAALADQPRHGGGGEARRRGPHHPR